MEKLPSGLLNRLPYRLSTISNYNNKYILEDELKSKYSLYYLNKEKYLTYLELSKSKYIEKSIFELLDDDKYYLLFNSKINKSEENAIAEKLYPILENIFEDFKFSIKLKKEHVTNFNNIYKVLDNKFTYLEMRIREVEVSPVKTDISWVILSKYHIILDAKIYLYDLQTDMFSFIDKSLNVDYGIIFKDLDSSIYKNGLIEPNFNIYYGPIGMLLARYYLYYDDLNIDDYFSKKIKKLDGFNQKYFCFMCLYIYILNIRLDILLNSFNISNYLTLTGKISSFIKKYGDYAKK